MRQAFSKARGRLLAWAGAPATHLNWEQGLCSHLTCSMPHARGCLWLGGPTAREPAEPPGFQELGGLPTAPEATLLLCRHLETGFGRAHFLWQVDVPTGCPQTHSQRDQSGLQMPGHSEPCFQLAQCSQSRVGWVPCLGLECCHWPANSAKKWGQFCGCQCRASLSPPPAGGLLTDHNRGVDHWGTAGIQCVEGNSVQCTGHPFTPKVMPLKL